MSSGCKDVNRGSVKERKGNVSRLKLPHSVCFQLAVCGLQEEVEEAQNGASLALSKTSESCPTNTQLKRSNAKHIYCRTRDENKCAGPFIWVWQQTQLLWFPSDIAVWYVPTHLRWDRLTDAARRAIKGTCFIICQTLCRLKLYLTLRRGSRSNLRGFWNVPTGDSLILRIFSSFKEGNQQMQEVRESHKFLFVTE